MTLRAPNPRLNEQQLEGYWRNLSGRYLDESAEGFEVICYAGMPDWFNRFMHRYQVKSFERLVAGRSFAGARVLDIGTGVGRWARWYAAWPSAKVVGVDLDGERIARARAAGGGPSYEVMHADRLEFASGSFDVVNSVTVLQHMTHPAKIRAIGETARVLRPGGTAVIFEIAAGDDAPHVFPWTREEWIAHFADAGLRPVKEVGDQYTPLLRLLKLAYRLRHGSNSRAGIDAMKHGSGSDGTPSRNMRALRAAVALSYPLVEVARFLPPRYARINGFMLVKEAQA